MEPAESPEPRRPGAEPDAHAALFSATERLAIKLAARAEELMSQEAPDMKLLMQVFEMCNGWLVKREKLKPDEPEDEGAGVDILRKMMEDPAAVVERLHANPKFRVALKSKGWLPPPSRTPGRPTKDQQEERQAYEERVNEMGGHADSDDSQLAAMLKGKV